MNNLPKLSPSDFEIIRFVGKGGFGTVFLVLIYDFGNSKVKKKDSQKEYCMKVVQKDLVSESLFSADFTCSKINYRNMYSERDSMINQTCPYLTKYLSILE